VPAASHHASGATPFTTITTTNNNIHHQPQLPAAMLPQQLRHAALSRHDYHQAAVQAPPA
jgi:hypothetical protein